MNTPGTSTPRHRRAAPNAAFTVLTVITALSRVLWNMPPGVSTVERVDPSPESGRGRPGEGKDRVRIGRDWWTDAVNAVFVTSGLGNEGGKADAVECTIWNRCECAPTRARRCIHACGTSALSEMAAQKTQRGGADWTGVLIGRLGYVPTGTGLPAGCEEVAASRRTGQVDDV